MGMYQSICTNNSATFVVAWTVNSATMASSIWTIHNRQERPQWWVRRQTWTQKWRDIVLSDEFRFCLQHHDGHIQVCQHPREYPLPSCIRHRHTHPISGMMVSDVFKYESRSSLVCTYTTLNSGRYISVVLSLVALPLYSRPAKRYVSVG